jgi:colanic acid/amylovoran biosynthesis protein
LTKILITDCHNYYNLGCHYNKGGTAVVLSTIKMLRKYIPDAEFVTFIQMPDDFTRENNIRIIRNKMFQSKNYSPRTVIISSINLTRAALWSITNRRFPKIANCFIRNRDLKEYAGADIIIDISMDHFSDDFGFFALTEQSKDMLTGVLLKKPVVVWAQSVGPFRSRLTSRLVKYALNKVSMIIPREEISAAHLQELGVNVPPVHITADPAFTMEPATKERASEILIQEGIDVKRKPLVGVTISWTALMGATKRSSYLRYLESLFRFSRFLLPEAFFNVLQRLAGRFKRLNMSSFIKTEEYVQIINYLVDKMNASVVFVPHATNPSLDDRTIIREVIKNVKHPEKVRMLAGDYSAPELKAVIGSCDLFIGAKMHSNIAALSMHVPTIGIQYSYKFAGIMGLLGQTEYICDDFTPDVVISKVDKAWNNREAIKADLVKTIGTMKQRAYKSAELVVEFLAVHNTNKAS